MTDDDIDLFLLGVAVGALGAANTGVGAGVGFDDIEQAARTLLGRVERNMVGARAVARHRVAELDRAIAAIRT